MLTATDKGTIRIVVICVAIAALACIGGVIGLALAQEPVPNILETLAVASLTGLVGLLAKTSSGAGGAEAVAALAAAKDAGLPTPPEPDDPWLTDVEMPGPMGGRFTGPKSVFDRIVAQYAQVMSTSTEGAHAGDPNLGTGL